MALWQAEKLRAAGIIGECYIVGPRDYAATNEERYGALYLRDEIVKTAKNFLDVPYRWGGTSAEDGFDCSGLTMAVYEYNGLKIPRSSKEQFRAGSPVRRSDLLKGDLIFFATSHRRKVSHVGIYIGNNEFIHAPGRGETIRIDSLSNDYYDEHYVGARRFL
jgi:cell wall-associated NlpC family hydrolase